MILQSFVIEQLNWTDCSRLVMHRQSEWGNFNLTRILRFKIFKQRDGFREVSSVRRAICLQGREVANKNRSSNPRNFNPWKSTRLCLFFAHWEKERGLKSNLVILRYKTEEIDRHLYRPFEIMSKLILLRLFIMLSDSREVVQLCGKDKVVYVLMYILYVLIYEWKKSS